MNLTAEDIYILKAIARTGFITNDHSQLLTRYRINKLEGIGLITSVNGQLIYAQPCKVFTLTEGGKMIIRQRFGINNIYKSDTAQLEHDYILGIIYHKLPLDLQDTWITEDGLRERFLKIENGKTTDGAFIYNGRMIGVEVLSDTYSKAIIEEKKEFARQFLDDSIFISS